MKTQTDVESGSNDKETTLLGVSVQNRIVCDFPQKHRDNQKGSFYFMEKRTCRKCKETKDIKEYNKGWLDGFSPICRDCNKIKDREYYSRTVQKKSMGHIKRKYGIDTSEYENLLQSQNRKCKICGKASKLHVDHDHKSGRVRGLLCSGCNKGLGFFYDDTDLLFSAIEYLSSCH